MSSNTAKWRGLVRQAAERFGVPPHLIEAVMELESGGDKNNVTNTGNATCPQAFGLMQIACGCSAVDCEEFSPIMDPETNIRAGARHLKINFESCGTWDGAICEFFSGHCVPNGHAVDILGTTDTMYVNRVKANWEALDIEDPGVADQPTPGSTPEGLDMDLAKLWFGQAKNKGKVSKFNEGGPVSKLWLGLGRYPSLVWTNTFGTRNYFRFADGTVIWRSGPEIPYRVLQVPHRVLGTTEGGGLNYPEGLDKDLATLWFGKAVNDGKEFRFAEDDPVSQRWLVLGRFPSLVWAQDFGTRSYFRFADGTVIWRPNADVSFRVLESGPVAEGAYPAGVDKDLARRWFGRAQNDGKVFRFDENHPVCQLWLRLGRFPSLIWMNNFDTREYFRFKDGTVIWRHRVDAPYRVLGGSAGVHSFSAIWGGGPMRITQDYLNPTGPDLYAYGLGYCLDGRAHPGIDVGMGYGDTLFAPMDGEITCAGTGRGDGADGTGCGAFNDTGDCCPVGGVSCSSVGAGRIEMKLDNGAMLIFGHSRESFHSAGNRVRAGQPIGTVGGMCGPHTHIEMRVRDASCTAGWRIVDPRDILGK